MKHFGEKVNLWVQYRCTLSHTPFSCSVTDSLLWRLPCHCVHTHISLRPNPPPPLKKKKEIHTPQLPISPASLWQKQAFSGEQVWETSEKCTPPPPIPTQAEWSQHWTRNTAFPGSSPALATGWISSCSQSFSSSHPRPRLVIANWLPPASWGF